MKENENHDDYDEFFDCDCETCVRRQREHIRKMNEVAP